MSGVRIQYRKGNYDKKAFSYCAERSYLRVHGPEKKIDVRTPGDRSAVDGLCKQLNGLLVKFNPVTESHLDPTRFESHVPPRNIERPKRTPWKHESDFDEFRFERRGVFSPGSFFTLLVFAAFCNFAVAFFVLKLCGFGPPEQVPHGIVWWMLFFLLILLTIVGLGLLLAFVSEILEPFRVTKWTFCYGEATHRFVKHVFYRTATFPLTGWNSLSVRFSDTRVETLELLAGSLPDEIEERYGDGECWELAFLDAVGADIVVIKNLRRPEALWMADVVLCERRTIR